MTANEREHFERLLEETIQELPDHLYQLLEEVPLIVEDYPSRALMAELDLDPATNVLRGLHSGVPLTERSVEHSGTLPDRMMLFREPIMHVARWRQGQPDGGLREQIRITLLHEIGHHFGLDEDDLTALGYG